MARDIGEADRGDGIVVERGHRTSFQSRSETRTNYIAGIVTKTDRSHFPKEYREFGPIGSTLKIERGGDRFQIIPKDGYDLGVLEREYMATHYEGHPNQPRGWDSLDDAREAVRKSRR